MPNNILRCAVIGVGNMGRNHVHTYLGIPDIKLVAVADLDESLLDKINQEFTVKTFRDFQQMIREERPDIVSVCVPTSFHYEVTKFCIAEKVNIILEKPITADLPQAEEILRLAKEAGVKILVGHIERFNPAVVKVKEMIAKGELGKITAIIARRVGGFPPQIKDANIAVDLAIHDIDIVNYLLDEIPQAVVVNRQNNHIEQRADSVEIFLKYQKTSAYIQANWITPVKIRKLTITGSEGYLEMDYISQQIEFYKSNYEKFKEVIGNFSDYILRFSEPDKIIISVAKKEPLTMELMYFIACVRGNREIDCQFAVEALKIALTN